MTERTKALSSFIANMKYEDIPTDVVDCGKMLTLHCAGVALAAKGQSPVVSSIASAQDLGTCGEKQDPESGTWSRSWTIRERWQSTADEFHYRQYHGLRHPGLGRL